MTSPLRRLLGLLRPSAPLVAGAVLAASVSAAAAAGYAWLIGPLLRSVLLSEPMSDVKQENVLDFTAQYAALDRRTHRNDAEHACQEQGKTTAQRSCHHFGS